VHKRAMTMLGLACLAASSSAASEAGSGKKGVSIEACTLRLTQLGQAADFQATLHFRLGTDGDGIPRTVSFDEHQRGLAFLVPGSVTMCVARWRLAPKTRYELMVRFGTAGSALKAWTMILIGGSCGPLELRLAGLENDAGERGLAPDEPAPSE
jgi:hypothetical protein